MESALNCSICNDLLEDPVILPCSCTICKKHVDEKVNEISETFECPKCKVDHDIPMNGFVFNSIVVSLMELSSLQSKREEAEKKAAIKSFSYLKDLFDEFKRINENPELEIDRVIEELKNKIDLRREEAKIKIDNEALELIDKLEKYDKQLKEALSEKVLSSEIDKEMMKSLESKISAYGDDENKLKDLKAGSSKWQDMQKDFLKSYELLNSELNRVKKTYLTTKDSESFLKKQKKFCGEERGEPIL